MLIFYGNFAHLGIVPFILLEKLIHDVAWVHNIISSNDPMQIKTFNFDIGINENYHKAKKNGTRKVK